MPNFKERDRLRFETDFSIDDCDSTEIFEIFVDSMYQEDIEECDCEVTKRELLTIFGE